MGSERPDQFSDYFGMAGHLAVMSEFLLRGYNVALPFVDRGDDVITLEDPRDEIRRVQVKTSKLYDCSGAQVRKQTCEDECRTCRRGILRAIFKLKGAQLREPDRSTKLFYALMFRHEDRWNSIVIPRSTLRAVHKQIEKKPSSPSTTLEILVDLQNKTVKGWNHDFGEYLNNWGDWPTVPRGAGATEEPTD